jgi:L-lactate utilization protein LutC
MTTIQASTQQIQTSRREWFSSNDIACANQPHSRQDQKADSAVKRAGEQPGSTDEKKKQQELIQTQIKVLQAQLAALQRQQAEEAQKKQDQKLGKVEGVNSPSDNNQIDIYI